MKILITGVTGFIGTALARQLLAEGQEVWGLVRSGSARRQQVPDGVSVIEGSLEDCAGLLPPLDACVHLAWEGAARGGRMDETLQQANASRTLEMMRHAAAAGCRRFVFAGSQAEVGMTLERLEEEAGPKSLEAVRRKITEETVCRPLSAYGRAKLRVLQEGAPLCESLGMSYVHLRIFSVYGRGDQPGSLLSLCARTAREGGTASLSSCEQMWNFLEIRDCAKAIADLTGCPLVTGESPALTEYVVNVASAESRILRDYVEAFFRTAGRGQAAFGGRMSSPEGTPDLYPDIGKLQGLTGFAEQYTFTEGIRDLLGDVR